MDSNAKPEEEKQPLPTPSEQEVEQFKKDFQAKNGFPPEPHNIEWWKFHRKHPLL